MVRGGLPYLAASSSNGRARESPKSRPSTAPMSMFNRTAQRQKPSWASVSRASRTEKAAPTSFSYPMMSGHKREAEEHLRTKLRVGAADALAERRRAHTRDEILTMVQTREHRRASTSNRPEVHKNLTRLAERTKDDDGRCVDLYLQLRGQLEDRLTETKRQRDDIHHGNQLLFEPEVDSELSMTLTHSGGLPTRAAASSLSRPKTALATHGLRQETLFQKKQVPPDDDSDEESKDDDDDDESWGLRQGHAGLQTMLQVQKDSERKAVALRRAYDQEDADATKRIEQAVTNASVKDRWLHSKKVLGARGLLLAKYWSEEKKDDADQKAEFFEDYDVLRTAHSLGGFDETSEGSRLGEMTAEDAGGVLKTSSRANLARGAREAYILGCVRASLVPEPLIRGSACHHAAMDVTSKSQPGEININMANYGLGDARATALAAAFGPMRSKLTSIDLSHNRLSSKALEQILGKLENACPVLKRLDVSRNENGMRSEAAGATLARCVKSAIQLESLAASRVGLTASSVRLMASGLPSSLHKLDLSRNQLGDRAAEALAALLSDARHRLSHLELGWNEFRGSFGARSIGKALRQNTRLLKLGLGNCSIDDEGGVQLALGIRTHPRLLELHCQWNKLGSKTALVLAHTLSVNHREINPPPLALVDLEGNPVGGDQGGRALVRRKLEGVKTQINLASCKLGVASVKGLGANEKRPSIELWIEAKTLQDKLQMEAGQASGKTLKTESEAPEEVKTPTYAAKFDMDYIERDSPFRLDLREPYDAAVAEEIVHAATLERGRLHSKHNAEPWQHIETALDASNRVDGFVDEDSKEPWRLPSVEDDHDVGMLTISLKRPRVPILKSERPEMEPQILENLISTLAACSTRLVRSTCLRFVACEVCLTMRQAMYAMEQLKERVVGELLDAEELVLQLWPRLTDEKSTFEFLYALGDPTRLINLMHANCLERFEFCESNATGHWKLELGHNPHRNVLSMIADIASREAPDDDEEDLIDTSEQGDQSCFRNARVNGGPIKSFNGKNILEFLDSGCSGLVEFDFISNKRPRDDVNIPKEHYQRIRRFSVYKFPRTSLILRVRLATLAYTLSSEDLLHLYDSLAADARDPRTGPDLIVCLFPRIRDLENFKLVLDHLPQPVVEQVAKRIGWLNMANPLKLGGRYSLDLRSWDNRILAYHLLSLSTTESGSGLEGGLALTEEINSEASIASLFQRLGSFHRAPIESTLRVVYTDVKVSWPLRLELMKSFAIGRPPREDASYCVQGVNILTKVNLQRESRTTSIKSGRRPSRTSLENLPQRSPTSAGLARAAAAATTTVTVAAADLAAAGDVQ